MMHKYIDTRVLEEVKGKKKIKKTYEVASRAEQQRLAEAFQTEEGGVDLDSTQNCQYRSSMHTFSSH